MSIQLLNKLVIYNSFQGLETFIIDEFNMIIEILNDDTVSFKSASTFLENYSFSYFTILAINNKVFVRQITPNKSPAENNVIRKDY